MMITMKKVLLTGAAGFIGAKTAQLLLKQNVEVVGIELDKVPPPKFKLEEDAPKAVGEFMSNRFV